MNVSHIVLAETSRYMLPFLRILMDNPSNPCAWILQNVLIEYDGNFGVEKVASPPGERCLISVM